MQCERATERGELASAVVQQGHSPIEVEQVIESLLDAELFVADAGLDRRAVLRRGLGAVAAGAVISIMLPEPAAALSVGPPAPAFFNTPGFSVTGTSSSPETPPVIDSLDSATTPLSASSSASVYVASDPSLGSLVWPAAFDAALNDGEGGWVFGVLDIQSEVDFMFSDDATATAAFLAATSFRIDFYDETISPEGRLKLAEAMTAGPP